MTAHTPGPWTAIRDYGNETTHPLLIVESEFGQITHVVSENCDIDEQVIADAELIAAAPDLLEAIELLLAQDETMIVTAKHGENDLENRLKIQHQARLAIRKAKGGVA